MPNWASVTRKVSGSADSVNKLYNVLDELKSMDKPFVKNGFGNMWLGCIVEKLGGNWEEVKCRGEVNSYCMDDGVLTIESEEAWGEMSEFRKFLEDKLGVSIKYYCSEPGMCEYYTNDKNCNVMYIEVYRGDDFIDSQEVNGEDGAIDYFDNCFEVLENEEFETMNEAVECLEKHGFTVNVNEYEYVE